MVKTSLPIIELAHELTQNGVPNARVAIALWRVGDSESEIQEAGEYIKESGYFLLDGAIPERTGYRRATDTGRTVAETPYSSLNQRADVVMQAIIDRLAVLKKKRIA